MIEVARVDDGGEEVAMVVVGVHDELFKGPDQQRECEKENVFVKGKREQPGMSNEGQNLLSIPKFDGDYDHWQMLMENLLRSKEWWHLIDPGYVEPEAAQLWESMKKKYQGNQRVQRAQLQALRREFEILEMKEGETKFRKKVKEEEQVLKVTHEGFGRGRGRSTGGSYRGRGRGRSSQHKATVECFNCHKLGHFQFECPEWGKRANFAEMDEDEELLLMAYIESRGASIEEVWFFDSGCSNHMSGNKEWFTDLDENFKHTVKLGNDSRINVTGRGNVRMKVNGITQVITSVYYIPELKTNLLSVGQLQEKGLAVLIQNNMCKVFHSRRGVIMQAEMSGNRMFYFKAVMASSSSNCYQTRVEDEAQLWHSRFGHLHYKALRTLAESGMVEGMPIIKDSQELCSHCLVGKQQRDPIPTKNSWRATKKLQLIHSDICGPISWEWEETEKGKGKDFLEWPDNDIDEVGEEAQDPNNSIVLGSNTNVDRSSPNTQSIIAGHTNERRTSERERRAPVRFSDYVSGDNLSDEEEVAMVVQSEYPLNYDEAVKDKKWQEAMLNEMESIKKNKTWELTSLPEGCKAIGTKWIFKTKLNEKGEIEKHKARLVAKGYSQQYGIDYTEVFAPVARLDTVRSILATAAQKHWEVFQLDVKSAFLQGNLEETVFVQQPVGFEVKGAEEKVYKLNKALYGLKQAPRAWYSRIESYFIKEGFKRCSSEHTLFTKENEGGTLLIVSLYVDDLIYTGNNKRACEEFKSSMMTEFDMSDLGKMRHFLGMEVLQNNKGIFICQRRYAKEVLERFGMENSNPVGNPIVPGTRISGDKEGRKVDPTRFKQLVGSLMYLTATRPDITYGVSLISRYMESPTEMHWCAAKRILRYIQGTTEFGILYKRGGEKSTLVAYSDSDFAGDLDDRKSTSGSVFLLAGGAISWSSKKQPVVTLSTTEAEYIAAAACACQCLWLK
nr:copia-type polyprotein [Tanacetum cinerariifolium]